MEHVLAPGGVGQGQQARSFAVGKVPQRVILETVLSQETFNLRLN